MDELAKRFGELADKYGPHVIEAARGAVQVEAWSTVVGGILCLCFSVGLFVIGWKIHRKKNWDEARYVFVAILFIASLFFGAGGVWSVADPWTWVAMKQPDLWIAKRALKI